MDEVRVIGGDCELGSALSVVESKGEGDSEKEFSWRGSMTFPESLEEVSSDKGGPSPSLLSSSELTTPLCAKEGATSPL